MSIPFHGFTIASFALLFQKEKYAKEKSSFSRSHPTSQHMYTHKYFVNIYEYIFAEIESIWIDKIRLSPTTKEKMAVGF